MRIFLERGFKRYIQHFVLIDVGFWHLLSGFFTYAQAAFWEGHFQRQILIRAIFWRKNVIISLKSEIRDLRSESSDLRSQS